MAELENKIENTKTETVDNTGAKQEEEKITLTQKELDDLIQRKSDARVTQALKTQEKKNADKLKEAEKLAKMSADEKYAYELEQREKLIEQRELELALAENKNACAKILADKGLSLALVDFCVDTNADVMSDNIKKLDSAFKASVKAEVEKRLSSNTPKRAIDTDEGITPEQFKKMSLAQQSQLFKESPDIYNAIVSQLKH